MAGDSALSLEVNSLDNHFHDVIHFKRLEILCLLVQNTVKCPKTLSSICSLYFLPEFRLFGRLFFSRSLMVRHL